MKTDAVIASIPTMNDEKRKNLRENAEGRLAKGPDAAAQTIIDALNYQEMKEKADEGARILDLSLKERIVESFRKEPFNVKEAKAVQALLDNPGATALALSPAAGWKGKSWQMHFGTMCKDRQAYFGPAPEQYISKERRGTDYFTSILTDNAGIGVKFKTEAVEAFAVLGLKGQSK